MDSAQQKSSWPLPRKRQSGGRAAPPQIPLSPHHPSEVTPRGRTGIVEVASPWIPQPRTQHEPHLNLSQTPPRPSTRSRPSSSMSQVDDKTIHAVSLVRRILRDPSSEVLFGSSTSGSARRKTAIERSGSEDLACLKPGYTETRDAIDVPQRADTSAPTDGSGLSFAGRTKVSPVVQKCRLVAARQ